MGPKGYEMVLGEFALLIPSLEYFTGSLSCQNTLTFFSQIQGHFPLETNLVVLNGLEKHFRIKTSQQNNFTPSVKT